MGHWTLYFYEYLTALDFPVIRGLELLLHLVYKVIANSGAEVASEAEHLIKYLYHECRAVGE